MNKKQIIPAMLVFILLSQASNVFSFPKVDPHLKTAPINTSQNWSENSEFVNQTEPVIKWWSQFHDPQLNGYIEDVAKFNYDLQTAVARIQEAKALRTGVQSSLYPQVDAASKYSRYQIFSASQDYWSGKALSILDAGFNAGWEIDLFGKNRWKVVAASEKIEEVNEMKHAVLVSLISDLATNYIELRTAQSQLDNLEAKIALQKNNLQLIQYRNKNGLATELDVVRAQELLQSLKSQAPALEASIKNSIYSISVLTGRNPDVLLPELSVKKAIPVPPEAVAVGLPADLILRRPDIRQAQKELAASMALVGAAKAELYPSILINGSFGFANIKLTDLANINSGLWSIAPAIDWNIFDRRLLKANLEANKAKTRAADSSLRQTILNATKEVSGSMAALQASQKTQEELNNATISSKKAYNMTNNAYKLGLKSQLEVLDAERIYINNESQLITNQAQVDLTTINLYRALGGGWQCF